MSQKHFITIVRYGKRTGNTLEIRTADKTTSSFPQSTAVFNDDFVTAYE